MDEFDDIDSTQKQPRHEIAELRQQAAEPEEPEIEVSPPGGPGADSGEIHRNLFDRVPMGLYRTTPEGRIIDVNPALVQMLGYPDRDTLLKKNAVDIYVDPEDRRRLMDELERHGTVRDFEMRMLRRDKRVIWVQDNVRAMRDPEGKVIYCEGALEDITERRRAERELKTLYQTSVLLSSTLDLDGILEKLIDAIDELIGFHHCTVRLVDPEQNVLVTKVARGVGEEYWKYRSVIPIGEHSYDLSGLAAADGDSHYAPDLMTLNFPGDVKENVIKKFDIKSYLSIPIKTADEVLGVFSIMTKEFKEFSKDEMRIFSTLAEQAGQAITRARLHEKLKESKEDYRSMFEFLRGVLENSPAGILRLDKDMKIAYENPEIKRIFGVPPAGDSAYLGKDVRAIPPFKKASLADAFDRLVKGQRVFAEVPVVSLTDRQLQVLLSGVPILEDSEFKGAVLLVSDVTETERTKEEKKELQEQLVQAQKMEAIGRLAGGIAHDFNNLLTTIHGYTELMMMKVGDEDPLYPDLETVDASAKRAAALTRQLLLFSRKQPTEMGPLNLNKVVENLLKMVKRVIGEDISVETKPEPKVWKVRGSQGNIEQVLMNLVLNARDAMPTGGRVTIKTENVTITEKDRIEQDAGWAGNFVRVVVEDTGVGMGQDTLARIFEPFFSTKSSGRGPGLGLAVAHGIITQHKGWISVHSEPGTGSTFKVYFPAISDKRQSSGEELVMLERLKGAGETILVVEDESAVRSFVARVLRENGYQVVEAATGQEGLEAFIAEGDRIRLVLTDVVLPDGSGLQMAHRLLSRKPQLKVLLTSGYLDEVSQLAAIREKRFPFLPKPYTVTDLLRAVREAM